jgi:hypothetical protein
MKTISMILLFALIPFLSNTQKPEREVNVIYGDHHIYTIQTPNNWINDKEAASKIGLTNFFYPINESNNKKKCYMYTNGYDKTSDKETLKTFMDADLKTFLKKYPTAKYQSVKIDFNVPIINGAMLSFENIPDRFKEETIYLETKETIIVFSFAAFTKSDYEVYGKIFDEEFVKSFTYRGSDPKPFLEYMKKKN